jgi:transposase InsO family protein
MTQGQACSLTFSISHTTTYFPFQMIPCDLCDSPIESFTDFKYYLIVVDDYSRYVWTFPLHLKSDVMMTLRYFHQYALTQFHLSIQIIQCDNGCEFDNQSLRFFSSSKGIVFCLSYPHTSL